MEVNSNLRNQVHSLIAQIAYGADPADTTYGFEDEVNR